MGLFERIFGGKETPLPQTKKSAEENIRAREEIKATITELEAQVGKSEIITPEQEAEAIALKKGTPLPPRKEDVEEIINARKQINEILEENEARGPGYMEDKLNVEVKKEEKRKKEIKKIAKTIKPLIEQAEE